MIMHHRVGCLTSNLHFFYLLHHLVSVFSHQAISYPDWSCMSNACSVVNNDRMGYDNLT